VVVHCGQQKVGWSDFADAVALFQAKSLDIQTLFDHDSYILGEIQGLGAHSLMTASHSLFAHSKLGTSNQRLATLEYLLSTLSAFQVANPWDTVYALLGLARDVQRYDNGPGDAQLITQRREKFSISVDYSLPLLQLLLEVVVYTIKQSGSGDIICRPWAPSAAQIMTWYASAKGSCEGIEAYRLPTWIRDTIESEFAPRSDKFGVQYDRINARSFVGQPESPIYNAAAGSRAVISLESIEDPTLLDGEACILVFRGYYIDSVAGNGRLGGYAQHGNVPPDWPALASWTNHRTTSAPDSFWRTLVGDRGPDGGRPPVWYRRACEHAWSESADPGRKC
jgi:hypothetical protein